MTKTPPAADVLDAFSAAWRAAAEGGEPPSLSDLRRHGAPLDHPGFGMLGRREKQFQGESRATYQVLQAGPDHQALGGNIMAGQWLDEILHPAHLASVVELYETICNEGGLHRWRCMNMVRNAEPLSYARVLGAISDDVGDGRCLAGIWVWQEIGSTGTFAS